MANEEAREADVKRLPPHISEEDVTQIVELVTPTIARTAYARGVAEGIRQARAAVQSAVERSADWGPNFNPGDALDAIDALGEDDRG